VKNMSRAMGGKGTMIMANIITNRTGAPSPLRLISLKLRLAASLAMARSLFALSVFTLANIFSYRAERVFLHVSNRFIHRR
jgi:hypothetical protein